MPYVLHLLLAEVSERHLLEIYICLCESLLHHLRISNQLYKVENCAVQL